MYSDLIKNTIPKILSNLKYEDISNIVLRFWPNDNPKGIGISIYETVPMSEHLKNYYGLKMCELESLNSRLFRNTQILLIIVTTRPIKRHYRDEYYSTQKNNGESHCYVVLRQVNDEGISLPDGTIEHFVDKFNNYIFS